MTVKPSTLKDEFNRLFQKHHALETDPGFISKKQKLKQLKLKPRHDLNTLSEIFQDPELVSRISQEAHEILRLSSTRAPRIRQEQDIIIHRKPQAKDVYRRTVIDDEVANMYNTVENSIRQEDEYINPIAPKQRKYLAHEKEWQLTPTEETIVPSTSPVEPAMNTMHESFPIALPSIPAATIDLDTNASIEHNAELNNMFDTVAQQMSQSPLKTVGPKHLYTYLPRQCDSFAYNYVKEDVSLYRKGMCIHTV
ncbi:uncharacterized protein B0P05DRAFT_467063 [Gilbertella persicaria]|uniref:uncharacterized protein n=1 Tax=Gilbertella persicaria TaxID=101096 RepID=UPI0022210FE8|nr:uncharacterized protein B0P05DRAFT_467063 [Gilbertella persicaria]KAI8084121.1 hypothetical protein B0P05DRAFT_467063 [Gilbertella persicaria]